MKPNDVAGSAITILGDGLDKHIEAVMQPVLGELDWPEVLRELDALKGKIGSATSATPSIPATPTAP